MAETQKASEFADVLEEADGVARLLRAAVIASEVIGAGTAANRFSSAAANMERHAERVRLMASLLERAGDRFCDAAPDSEWWHDYYSLTGQPVVLGEYGWELRAPLAKRNRRARAFT